MSRYIDFYHLLEIFQVNTRKITDTDTKTGLDAAKSPSKK